AHARSSTPWLSQRLPSSSRLPTSGISLADVDMDPNQGKLGSTTLIRCANTGRDFDKGDGDAAHEVLYSLSQRRSRRNWVAHRERLWRHFSHSAQRSCRGTLRGPAPAWAPVPSVASAASERKRDAN